MTREQNYNDKDLVEIIGLPRSPLGVPGWIVDIGDVGPESALRQNGRFLKFIPQDSSQPVEYINADNIWGIRPFDPAAREAEQRASIQRMKDDLGLLRDETRLRSVTPEPRSIIRCASCKEVTFDRDEGSRPCACQRPVDSNPVHLTKLNDDLDLPRSMKRCGKCRQAYNAIANKDVCPYCEHIKGPTK